MNRRSSIYTVRVRGDISEGKFSALISWFDRALSDRGVDGEWRNVSFRAEDDTAAMMLSTAALKEVGLYHNPAILTTGFGVHRRVVGQNAEAAGA